ncbi:glycosyltransferase, partial [Halioglobus sp.]|nr:glycosyltransferase [Halioglobus sp.]
MSADPQKIVVVLGMHRSGTSAIAGLLEQLGANLGERLIPAAGDNTRGFFEDAECVALNEDILNELGLGWQSCSAIVWDESTLQLLQARFAERAIGIVRRLTRQGVPVVAVKDPRMSRLLPFWQQIFTRVNVTARYLWVTRSPNAVSQSLHARNGYSEEVSLALWARYNLDIVRDTKGTGCERIDFDQVLSNEDALAKRLASICGLGAPEQGLNSFIAQPRQHSQADAPEKATGNSKQSLHGLCNALYDQIIAGRGTPASTDLESVLTGYAPLLNQLTALVDRAKSQEDVRDHDHNLLREKLNTTRRSADLREEELQTEIQRIAAENDRLAIQNKGLNVASEELYAELHRLNAQVEDILSSRSWRLTSGLRFVGRKLRGVLSPRIYTKVYVQFIFSKLSHRIASFATSSRSNQAATRELARGRGRALAGALERFDQNPQELPDIDITVVTHNSSRWIEGFLNSLAEQSYPLSNIGLFVTDNHSTDGSFEKMRTFTEPFADRFREISIENGPNNGFGHGQNAAIARGDSRFILITNIDVEFTPQSILEVVSHALRDPKDIASWELRQQPFEHPKYYDPVTLHTSWSSHACILMLRDAYDSVGGYEKRIF